jgi:hypothetical protein
MAVLGWSSLGGQWCSDWLAGRLQYHEGGGDGVAFRTEQRIQTRPVWSMGTTETPRDLVLHVDAGGARVQWALG